MAIYTSYFSNWRNFPEDKVVISITQFSPKNWKGLEMRSLAPSADLLRQYKNNEIDEMVFKWKYLRQLNSDENLRPRIISLLKFLEKNYKNVILCCYEKTGDFCHRYLLTEWLYPDIKAVELV